MVLRRSAAARLLAVSLTATALGCPSPPNERDGSPVPIAASSELGAPAGASSSPGLESVPSRGEGNHLAGEMSPYLKRHADDPVDWYPWGDEALARAEREGKPIFMSIGYSSCHWCHVMEEESFEDDEVAAFLNAHFVSIKVDREQRPDLDSIYLDAVAALGGPTGWPLTVVLTPEAKPFFGGTYFPRRAARGLPGILDVLEEARRSYAEEGERVAARGQRALEQVERRALLAVGAAVLPRSSQIGEALARLVTVRDVTYGGFGSGQKFPRAPLLLAHLRHVQRGDDPSARRHLVATLDAMRAGGIYDHLAGSFHRYTVDVRWHLPHFEKTLYDNAQLAALFIDTGRTLGRDDLVAVGRGVLDELLRQWQGPDGGFVVGFDADDPIGEGRFYSWTPSELRDVLPSDDAAVVGRAFGVTESGEASLEGRSVLHRDDDDATAAALGMSVDEVRSALERSLPRLAEARSLRPAPSIDDKAIVAWNGLAIMALADASRWLDAPRYRDAAVRAGEWILDAAWAGPHLQRGTVVGRPLGEGMLDDHALAGLAFVRLHAATGELRWLAAARRIADEIVAHFHDPERHLLLQVRGGAASERGLPLRRADFGDDALPSGGAAGVLFLLELGAITGDEALYDVGWQVLVRTTASVLERPHVSGMLLVALDHATAPVREVVIAGEEDDPRAEALWRELASSHPRRVLPVRVGPEGAPSSMVAGFPALEGKRARRGEPTAYVCERSRCESPTSDPQVLRRQLAAAVATEAY